MVNDLTLGIPQSGANPLLNYFDQADEMAEQHRRAMEKWRQENIAKIDRAVLEPEAFFAENPVPAFDPDPQAARDSLIVASYLALQNDGKPVTGPVYPEIFRDRIAQERFGGRGAGSDQAFLAEIRNEAQGRKDAMLLMQEATTTAATSAILSAAGEPGATWDGWIREARTRPGYRRDQEDIYFTEWHDRQRDLQERMAPVRELIARQWAAMKEGKPADLEGLEGYLGDEEQRETLLFAIGGLVKALPKEQQPGILANLRKQFLRRDLPLQAEGVMRSMRPFDRDQPLPDDYLDQLEPGTNLEEFQKRQRAAFERDSQLRERFVRKLESIVNDQYDPIVTYAREGSNWQALERGLYAAPGVGLTMATATLPGAGNFISYEVLRKTSSDMARESLVQGGMTEDQADTAAEGIGGISALIQLPMERLGLAAVTNRIPGISKAINKLTTNLATRYLARAGSSAAVEFGTEMAQDLVPSIVQDVAAAASQDIPDVRWTGEGGVFQDYDKQSLEVLGAILPLSLVMAGGGVFTDLQIRRIASLDDTTLQAAGISPESVAAIRSAKGIGEQESALRAGWESRDIASQSAQAAQAELTARTRAEQATAAEASRTGIMPTFYRTADGWSVRDGETGAEIGTSTTPDGALRLAMAHSAAIEEDNADQIAALGSLLEAGDVVAGTDQEGVRQTAVDLRPGQVVTTSQQAALSEQDDLRIRQQIEARERMGGSDGGTARMVLGQSVTETRQKVRNTVNRINAGGSVLTVFHEETHGFFREALATGRLTRDETLAAIRALETVLAGKTTKDGQQLRFLPDGEVTDLQLDEAVSELMEAEILRTRKTAGRSGTAGRALPPGLVTRNLTAMARLAPGAAQKLRDFIAAVRAFWGLTFARATAIKSAIREGTLDEQQLEDFKARLFGLQEQDDLEQAARDAEARILDGTEQAPALDGDPFSLAARPSITEDNAPAFSIAGPRAKGFQAAKEAGRTFTGRDGKERFELNTSDARFLGLMDVTKTGDTWVRPLVSLMDWPELFDNYPAARSITVEAVADLPSDVAGRFEMERNAILLSKDYPVAKQASFLLHELQHWIQNWENFAQGGSPEQFAAERARLRARMNGIETSEEYRTSLPIVDRLWNQFWENDAATEEDAKDLDAYILKEHASFRELRQIMAQLQELDDLKMSDLARYRALPGEIEARGVQARASMTAEERAASPFMEYFSSFSIGRAVQLAKQTEKTAKIAEEDFFTTFWPRMMKLAGQNLKASTRNINEAAKRAVVDIGEWVKKNPKFQDYYSEDWKNTRAILDDTFEGFTDDLFKGFRLFTGLTSPSTPLDGNLADAVQIVNLWISRGSLLSLTLKKSEKGNRSVGPGPFPLRSNTGATKIFSLHVVEELFRRFGSWEQTVDFLNEPVSVKDLHAFNKEMGYAGSVGGIGNIRRVVMEATGQDEMIPRMFIFGQKVGAYTLNTLGDHRYTTTDIWESRFIRSYFPEMFKTSDGLPVNEDEHTIFQRFAGAFNKQFEAHYGIKLENSALQAIRWFYMLAHAKEAGYRHARTNQTISGYTLQAVRNYIGRASGNRGRGSRGSGGAEQGPSFSLGPAKLAELLRKDAIARIKDPVRRTQVMSRIAREMEAARLELERLELVAGSKRLKKSLAREARIREALRREELENEAWARHWQVLSDDDLVKLKQQPAHKLLTNPANPLRGRIQSRTETIRRNPELYAFKDPAEYDGSDTVSRSVFGGSLTPDQAVEELVEAGLLKPGSKPDDLWQLLEAEALSVSNRKRDLAIAREELREARQQAKDETNVWLREQGVVQETTFGDKQEILRALGVLDGILSAVPAEIRGKVGGYTQLARISTNEAKLAFLKDRLAKVDTELERWLKDQFDREFRALLDRAKPEKDEAGKKPRGKIGADVHELFAAVRESMTMTAAEVEAEAVALESLAASGDYTAAQESHLTLQANLIRLAGEWNKADAARREAALVEATRVFEAGYLAHKTETLRKREHRAKVRDALQQATGKAGTRTERRTRAIKDEGTKAGRALTTLFSLMSFEQVVERAFGRDSQEARDLVDWERRAAHAKTDAVQNKLDQLDDLFATLAGGKLKGEELRWKMSRPDAITIDGQTFSELEAITATLMWRQEDGRRHMTGHVDDQGKPSGEWNYTQDFIDRLESELSDNAKAVRLHLAQQYAAEYDRLNAVFRDLNGVSLPRHKHYSPLTVKPVQSSAGQMLDPITGTAMGGAGFTPGSLKNRSQTAIAEPDFKDALQVYIAHAKQMEHWIAYAPFATEAMAILNAREIGNSVEAAAGKEALSVLRSWLDVFAQGGTRDAAAHLGLNRALNRITGRAAATALVGRVSVLAIQSTQLGAALAEMPLASYLSRLARLFAGRLDWSGALSSDYIQRRKAQMPPVVQQAMEGLTSSKPSRLKYAVRKLGETISGADALFTSGTFAIVLDYQLKQAKALGLSGAEAKAFALESAERATDRVAQPVRPGTRSLYEVTSVNPLARISWSFASDARQKLALSAYALANRTPAEAARALAVTWIAGGVFASLIRAAMRDIRDDGEDDEIFDAENWDPKRLALSALTGPLAGIPALGDAVEAGLFAAFDEFLPEGNLISGVRSAFDSVGQLPKWLTGDRQGLDNALKDSEALMSGLGLASDSAAAVTSLLHVVRDLFGLARNVTGN